MKYNLFCLLCFGLCIGASAQTVFAPVGSIWHFEHIPDLEPAKQNYIEYKTVKDTLYYGKLCSKIIGKKIRINSSSNGYDTLIQETQYTYTSGDTVFYYNHNFNRFLVLYNFNVIAGDTVSYHVPYMVSGKPDTIFRVKVDSVRVVNIDGMPLKRIWAITLPTDIFAMGMLTERLGPLNAYSIIGYKPILSLPSGGGLRCYQDGVIDENVGYWGYGCEELDPLGIDEEEKASLLVTLSPNPARDWVNIEAPGLIWLKIGVSDVLGREINVNYVKQGNTTRLDMSGLMSGVYFVRLIVESGGVRTIRFYKN